MNDPLQHHEATRSRARTLLAALPTLLVLGALAAVGWWGHHTGWKAGRFAQLFGGGGKTAAEDWCVEHNVPDSQCIACHPELAGESAADWCKEHGVPESKCTACHPEILLTGVAGDWCVEHNLPESGCTICHPEIARKGDLAPDPDAPQISAGAGKPDPRTCQTHALKVQFASLEALEKTGVRLGKVVQRPMSDSIVVDAECEYVETSYARLAPRAAGTVRRVLHAVGAAVQAGELLAEVDSPDLARARAEWLEAQAEVERTATALERLRASSSAGFRTESERLSAEAAAREAEVRRGNARSALASLGFELPAQGAEEALAAACVPIRAPFAGVVVGSTLVAGEMVDPGRTRIEVADLSRMWITLELPEPDARRVALGQFVRFRTDGAPDEAVEGHVTWISSAVDEITRTVRVRAEVENPERALRAHSFGRAQLFLRASPEAVAVPSEAVQWEGCCHVAFVRIGATVFQTRKLRVGAKDAAYTEVLGGLLPGEVVVTTGSHVLKSEILKSSLGAGCCAAE